MGSLQQVVLVLALVAAGLGAGVYFTFTVAVMPGLARLDDGAFVTAMQRINVAIVNPVFLLAFLGAPVLGVAAVVVRLADGDGARLQWLVASAALSVLVVVLTGAANVPRNNALAAAADDDPTRSRVAFEGPWRRWNTVRTLVSTSSLVCLAIGVVLPAAG